MLSALSVSYSQAFGQSYFRDAAFELAFFVLTRHPDIASWAEFREHTEDAIRHAKPWELNPESKRDGAHVLLIIKRLADLPALNDYGQHPQQVLDTAIDFAEAFKSPHHYHFALPVIANGFIAGEVARIVLSSLLSAAYAAKQRRTKVVLVIDEFGEAVSGDLEPLLTQARGLGIGVILANQTSSQLVKPDCDMRPIIEGNTSLQIWMQSTDREGREQMQRLGGQHIVHLKTKTFGPNGSSVSRNEHVTDRVSPNLISEVGSDPRRMLVRITDNDDYACYGDMIFAGRTMFHESKNAYETACGMAWPAQGFGTFINTGPPPSSPPPPSQSRVPLKPKPTAPTAASPLPTNRARTHTIGNRPKSTP